MSTNISMDSDSVETPARQTEPTVQTLAKNGRNGRATRSGNGVSAKTAAPAQGKEKASSVEMEAMRSQLEALNRSQAIIEFEDDGIETLQEAVARRHGFTVTHHKMELYGLCADCQSSSEAETDRPSSRRRA